jgi:hypothetical protein
MTVLVGSFKFVGHIQDIDRAFALYLIQYHLLSDGEMEKGRFGGRRSDKTQPVEVGSVPYLLASASIKVSSFCRGNDRQASVLGRQENHERRQQ